MGLRSNLGLASGALAFGPATLGAGAASAQAPSPPFTCDGVYTLTLASIGVTAGKMMRRLATLAAATALVAASNASAASLFAQAQSGVANAADRQSGAEGPLSVSISASDATRSDAAAAVAGYGYHKVSATAYSTAFSAGSSAESRWNDDLRVTMLGGGSGFLNVALDITADLTTIVPEFSGATSSFFYHLSTFGAGYTLTGSTSTGFTSAGALTQTIRDQGATRSRYVVLAVPFTSGQLFSVASRAGCGAGAHGSGNFGASPAIATCDAGHSVYWGGVVSVSNAGGAVIEDWSLTSTSGTDYTQSFVPSTAVPETGTWALMIAGFGATGAMLRRRRTGVTPRNGWRGASKQGPAHPL